MKKKRRGSGRKPAQEIHVLNGPNINMLGFREPDLYGTETLEDLERKLIGAARQAQVPVKLTFHQTNFEGEMIDYVQSLALANHEKGHVAGVILNPAAWTHTSVALRDAVLLLKPIPIVEVHMTNPAEREEFRHFSYFEDLADYRVVGMGQDSYVEALRWLVAEMKKERIDVH